MKRTPHNVDATGYKIRQEISDISAFTTAGDYQKSSVEAQKLWNRWLPRDDLQPGDLRLLADFVYRTHLSVVHGMPLDQHGIMGLTLLANFLRENSESNEIFSRYLSAEGIDESNKRIWDFLHLLYWIQPENTKLYQQLCSLFGQMVPERDINHFVRVSSMNADESGSQLQREQHFRELSNYLEKKSADFIYLQRALQSRNALSRSWLRRVWVPGFNHLSDVQRLNQEARLRSQVAGLSDAHSYELERSVNNQVVSWNIQSCDDLGKSPLIVLR